MINYLYLSKVFASVFVTYPVVIRAYNVSSIGNMLITVQPILVDVSKLPSPED